MSSKEKARPAFNENSSLTELKRRFHANPFIFTGTVIVLVIVIIAFVFVPAFVPSAGGMGTDKRTFGYYNGTALTYNGDNFFARALQQYSQYAQYYGWDTYTIWQRSYYAYLGRVSKLSVMKAAGYAPSQSLVNEKTAKLAQFQDENGKFSRALYNRLDAASRISLMEEVKNDIILERYDADMTNIRVSSLEKEFIGDIAKVQRSFKIAAVPYSSYPDDEVKTFIEKNPDLFVSLHFSQITVPKEADAKKILQNLQSGGTNFEDAARNQSKDEFAGRGGDAGARLAHEIRALVPGETERSALTALTKGNVSEIIKTAGGWAIFRAEEDAKAASSADTGLLSQARNYINTYERGIVEDYLLSLAQKVSGESAGGDRGDITGQFENAARDAGFTVSDFGPLPLNYGDSRLFSTLASFGIAALEGASNNPKTAASYDDNFWKTIFQTGVNSVSKPVVLNGRQSYITLILPKEENANDTTAKANSESMFTDSWAENTIYQNIEDTVLTSSKFEDNFDATFQYLYPDQYYQHSFSSFNF